MWAIVLVLLVIIVWLMFHNIALREAFREERRRSNRESSLRAATEIAFCEVVQEQIGDRLWSNRKRVAETTSHFDKTRSDERGPN